MQDKIHSHQQEIASLNQQVLNQKDTVETYRKETFRSKLEAPSIAHNRTLMNREEEDLEKRKKKNDTTKSMQKFSESPENERKNFEYKKVNYAMQSTQLTTDRLPTIVSMDRNYVQKESINTVDIERGFFQDDEFTSD